jgi:anaerobic selenocysteine-containing dehydrogenase
MNETTTTAHRICPLCEACCGLELKLQGGKVTAIRGDEADPFSRGYLCPKGVALKELHEDPDRLRTPLVKRDGQFVPTSWDEAFAEIQRRLAPLQAEFGRDAVAVSLGNPIVHKFGLSLAVPRLLKGLGTRNVFSASTLDQMPKQLSSGLMFGHWLSVAVPDIARTQFLLVLGANPLASNGSMWTVPDFRGQAKALHARGGKLVVVDPRRTETAAVANQHLRIRPGGDVFLLLGLVHTLFDEGLVRPGRLAEHLNGVDELQAAVAGFAPEAMAGRCGIPAVTMRTLARELAAAPQAAVYGRMGTCTQPFGTLCSWLIDALNVLTGQLDAPGGVMFPKAPAFAANTAGAPGRGRGIVTGRHTSRVSGAPEVFGEIPMGCLAEEIETPGPGQVKALLTVASNPVLSAPNGPRLAAALEQLGFMVSVDIYLNETTRHADVILPGLSPLEDLHYDLAFAQLSYRNQARFNPPVLPLSEPRPTEWDILLRLAAIAAGQGADADVQANDQAALEQAVRRDAGEQADAVLLALQQHPPGPQRWLDLALRAGPYGDRFGATPGGLNLQRLKDAPHGIDLGDLQPRIPEVLRTPSGRIELAPAPLLDDLQRVRDDLQTPAPELVVIGRRQVRSNNSWMHNLPLLAKGPYRCTALVHPQDARRLGLVDGGLARIANGPRVLEAQVELSEEMMPGVLSLPHGWGHDLPGTQLRVAAERPGVNLNALLDETLRDPLSGNAVLAGVAVQVSPAAQAG